ncbi:MAG: hypothetical protein GY868_02615, partial [Deltaproteobacteria bacterium]|nr:hypothetical protein [Deltaproteobacteria bacterium]
MKKGKVLTTFLLIFSGMLLASAGPADAIIELDGGRLVLNGFVKEMVYVRTTMQEREEPYHDS